MTALVVSMATQPTAGRADTPDQHMQVVVNIQAEVLDAEVARRKANVWLLENVGNLLSATTPELMLGERLFWRYDVMLGLPNLAQPGSGALYRIGQIMLDAVTGEVQNPTALAQELRVHVASMNG